MKLPGLRTLGDISDPTSLSNTLRDRRFRLFDRLTAPLSRPLHIIDIGGTTSFWERRGWAGHRDVRITLVNLAKQARRYPNIDSVVGDARDLHEFDDKSFDVAFSNSVIEHLSSFDNERLMANEVQRVARAHWVQTPNFWFPIEPHFHFVGWQWLPRTLRIEMLRRRRCGWRGPCPDREEACKLVDEIRLLRQRELAELFPRSTIRAERICGLAKSWIVYGGFAECRSTPR